MIKTYMNFEDIEKEVRENVVPIVYKYRTWDNDLHKKIITNREVWFAHPFTLNDPYDVRPPYNIINNDIDWNVFKEQLKAIGKEVEKGITEGELEAEVNVRLNEAKTDPVKYFTKNRTQYILEEKNYNHIGIFSCCTSGLNEPMWAHYGNNHSGFAVGFDTVAISKALSCGFGYVNYDDTPIDYIIMGDNSGTLENEMYQKSKRWTSEEELRFVTAGVGFYRERTSNFPPDAVKEVLVGMDTSEKIVKELSNEIQNSIGSIPVFRVGRKANQYGFEKVQIR